MQSRGDEKEHMIPFNKPCITGNELAHIARAVELGKLSGNGEFTKRCQEFFEARFEFPQTLLTNSCTSALEMAAILSDVKPGDEVIVPSFTFVSTANAFVLRGARIVFADSLENHPNINVATIDSLITPRTKAIVAMHYGGVMADMQLLRSIIQQKKSKGQDILLIEDAAHAIGARSSAGNAGEMGDFAAFSFHETKNLQCGEGGMLVVNNKQFAERAEIVWEKGTNRVAFAKGTVDSYDWIDIGSSYLLSELSAAYLFGQLENYDIIMSKRKTQWDAYFSRLQSFDGTYFRLPLIPSEAAHNNHIFYLQCRNSTERGALIHWLSAREIMAVSHYKSLHRSPMGSSMHDGRPLPNSDRFEGCLVRLPLFHDLTIEQIDKISEELIAFYQ